MILGYNKVGKGSQKVVVLHDWFCDQTEYAPTIPYLNQTDFQYAFLDLRGYGLSKEKEGSYTVAETAQDVINTVDKLGWSTFHLMGHSMSGLVGQLICALAGQRVQSFIAVTPVTAKGMPEADEDIFNFMIAAAQDNDEMAAQAVGLMTSNKYGNEWANLKVKNWRESSIAEARVGYTHMFVRSNILEEVKGTTTPMCVICTSHDNEAHRKDVMESTFKEWFPNVEIHEIQNAGHYPMQETPVAFAFEVNRYLETQIHKE